MHQNYIVEKVIKIHLALKRNARAPTTPSNGKKISIKFVIVVIISIEQILDVGLDVLVDFVQLFLVSKMILSSITPAQCLKFKTIGSGSHNVYLTYFSNRNDELSERIGFTMYL